MHYPLLCYSSEKVNTVAVTPLSKPRKKGRPSAADQLLITAERTIYKSKKSIIDMTPEALEVIYQVMLNKDTPPQVRSSNAKLILEMANQIYVDLLEMEDGAETATSDEIGDEDIKQTGIICKF